MKINFQASYLNRYDIINNITQSNKCLPIYMFYFFKKNQFLYTKKMVYNSHDYSHYKISNNTLNSFYKKQYKIFYIHYVILLTDIYVKENQKLIYMSIYNDNFFCNFNIGSYYKFCSREYIELKHRYTYHTQIDDQIGDFYYFNYYITKQEINDIQNQLKIYGQSIKLLYVL